MCWGEWPTCVLGILQNCNGFFASLVTLWAVILLFLPLSPQFGDGSEALSSVT